MRKSKVDIVVISDLHVDTTIGAYDWEKDIKQKVVIDLELGCDTTRAGQTDDLNDALDYKAVADRVTEFAANSSYQLIEALAENIAALLLAEFHLPWLRVKVSKPTALPDETNVAVVIERKA